MRAQEDPRKISKSEAPFFSKSAPVSWTAPRHLLLSLQMEFILLPMLALFVVINLMLLFLRLSNS